MGCFSGRLMSAASDQKLFCKLRSPFCCSLDEFVEEKVISPPYSSAILTPPLVSNSSHPMDCSTPGFPFLLSPGVCSNSCQLSQWYHPTVSSSVMPFSSCSQSFPTTGPFPESQLFASGGQSIGASASASVLPMNIQGQFPLALTALISLQAKGLSRVFSSTIIWRHQFFDTQLSLWSNSNICTWLLEKS